MTNKSYSAIELHPQDHLVFKEQQLLSSCNKKPSFIIELLGYIKNELNIHL